MRHSDDTERIPYLFSEKLAASGFVRHGFSMRRTESGREVRLYPGKGTPEEVGAWERRFFPRMDLDPGALVASRQVHGDHVHRVAAEDVGRGTGEGRLPDTDGLVTDLPGAVLAVYVADCAAVFLADPVTRSIGLCHSGRKGTLAEIGARAVERMRECFGARPEDILAWIAPCICRDCYEVGDEIAEETRALWGDRAERVLSVDPATGRYHFDLPGANRQVLLGAGLSAEKIDCAGLCTCCRPDLFYSYRGDGGIINEMCAFMAIRSE